MKQILFIIMLTESFSRRTCSIAGDSALAMLCLFLGDDTFCSLSSALCSTSLQHMLVISEK